MADLCNSNWKLSAVSMFNDREHCKRLTVEYTVVDKNNNVDKVIIDGIPLHFSNKPILEFAASGFRSIGSTVDFGFGKIEFDKKTRITEERIHNATKKMTVEEIEKELGYKVEIVSEKEEIGCNNCKHSGCPGNLNPCLCCCTEKDPYSKWERRK